MLLLIPSGMHDGEYMSTTFLIPPGGRAKPGGLLARWGGVLHSTNTACMEEFNCTVERFSITQGKVFDIWVEAHHPLLSFGEGEEGVVNLGDRVMDIPPLVKSE